MRVENWCGHGIRFIEKDGEWWAILKDICDALKLDTHDVSKRIDPDMMIRIRVNTCDPDSKRVRSRARKTQDMLAINEFGIYEALFASRKLEARKFRRWSATVLRRLRQEVGLDGYEIMRMTEPEIQENIDGILDTLFFNEETGQLMRSVTIQCGDVEQIPFEV